MLPLCNYDCISTHCFSLTWEQVARSRGSLMIAGDAAITTNFWPDKTTWVCRIPQGAGRTYSNRPTRAVLSINKELISLYWDIGKRIVESQKERAWEGGVVGVRRGGIGGFCFWCQVGLEYIQELFWCRGFWAVEIYPYVSNSGIKSLY